jgi:hypothetical protein
MSDSETILQLIDNLTAFGILSLVVVALLKGWVIATPMQTRIELLRTDYEANRVAKDALHEEEVRQLQDRYKELQDTYIKDLRNLYEGRITALEQLLQEREARVEQGVQMIAGFTQAQDSLSTLAKMVKDKS